MLSWKEFRQERRRKRYTFEVPGSRGATRLSGDGKRLELSAMVLFNEAENMKYGIDIRRWVSEGLLDEVFPYLTSGAVNARQYDMSFYRDACPSRKVRLRPVFVGWSLPNIASLVQQAVELYDRGADGVTFWDGNVCTERTNLWSVVSRSGHVEELRERALEGAPTPVTVRFHKLGDLTMDGQYPPTWGF